jgi:hypothetical protein
MEGNKGKKNMENSLQTQLINFLLKQDACMRIIEHDGNYYHTSEKMKAMGLKCCHSCGYLMPIEKENCKCGERVFVVSVSSAISDPGEAKILKRNKQGKRIVKEGFLVV